MSSVPPTIRQNDNVGGEQMMNFRVAQFNTFTTLPEPIRFLGQRERLRRMAEPLAELDADVIVLNECIIKDAHTILLPALARYGYRFCTRQLISDAPLPSIVNGGVFVVSRWPIVQEYGHVFSARCGSDALAAKGVVYARIAKHGKMFNVLGTHMQAWDSAEAVRVRVEQSLEIRGVIDFLRVPADEPLLLAGDLNIDREHQWSELQHFLHSTRMNVPPVVGPERFTLSNHNQLYGNDVPSMYKNDEWPDGCMDVYLQTLRCVCCKNLWCDYVLHSRAHQHPADGRVHAASRVVPRPSSRSDREECESESGSETLESTSPNTAPDNCQLRAVPIRTDEPYRVRLNLTTWRMTRDLSDHYAVVASLAFACATPVTPPPEESGGTFGTLVFLPDLPVCAPFQTLAAESPRASAVQLERALFVHRDAELECSTDHSRRLSNVRRVCGDICVDLCGESVGEWFEDWYRELFAFIVLIILVSALIIVSRRRARRRKPTH